MFSWVYISTMLRTSIFFRMLKQNCGTYAFLFMELLPRWRPAVRCWKRLRMYSTCWIYLGRAQCNRKSLQTTTIRFAHDKMQANTPPPACDTGAPAGGGKKAVSFPILSVLSLSESKVMVIISQWHDCTLWNLYRIIRKSAPIYNAVLSSHKSGTSVCQGRIKLPSHGRHLTRQPSRWINPSLDPWIK